MENRKSEKWIVRLFLRHRRQRAVAGANQRLRRQGENLFAHLLLRQIPRLIHCPNNGGTFVLTIRILMAINQPARTITARPASHNPRIKLAGLSMNSSVPFPAGTTPPRTAQFARRTGTGRPFQYARHPLSQLSASTTNPGVSICADIVMCVGVSFSI